jgi:3-phenylpropionate/cinnamic acid dioxygenase small subunit
MNVTQPTAEFIPVRDAALICTVEQFYFFEAHLLDERQYLQWLALWTEDAMYRMPSRFVAQADTAHRGTEKFHAVVNELSRYSATESPLREENLFQLALRADRALKHNAWAENPPPRCRRLIGNVMLQQHENVLHAQSIFQLIYSRHSLPAVMFSGQRRDVLVSEGAGFRIRSREVILDWNVIMAPTVGLFF